MAPMHLSVYTHADAFDALAADWQTLLKSAPFDTVFYTPLWQRLTWDEFGAGQLCIVTVRDEAGALVGVAPLAIHEGVVGFAAYKEISDYLDIVVAAGHETEVYQAVAGWLTGAEAPAWTTLSLTNVIESSGVFGAFADALRASGCQIETPAEDVCPVITLPASFDVYLESLDGRERRELQRKLRRASEESGVVYATDASTLDRDVDDFLTLMKASMTTKNDFMTPRMEAFFHKMARSIRDAGWLQLSFLEVGDEAPRTRAAAYVNFIYNNQVLVYNSGLDPMKFAHLSPGQVLIARLIEQAIADKRSAFDFLQGNESYKYKLGGKDVKLNTLVARR